MVSNELALRRDQRTNALEFLRVVRIEQDRLENMSPNILPQVIERFNKQFKDRDIEKPEVAGDLDEVLINHGVKKPKGSFTPEINERTNTLARRITNKLSTVPNSVVLPSTNILVKKIDDIV
jgi:hypothetical protein